MVKAPMAVTGVHFLVTYQCTQECDHCFVFSSPRARAVFSGNRLTELIEQCRAVGTVEWVFFEGGEPFLYYPVLMRGVRRAAQLGFRVGIVTNAYWATSLDDALLCLETLGPGCVQELSLSSDDLHHGADPVALKRIDDATAAADRLGIPVSTIRVEHPVPDGGDVMFRGRAADVLTAGLPRSPASAFRACPHEPLAAPERVHVDPLGLVHVCQGITIGNAFETPLDEILQRYHPTSHAIVGPLLRGGPAELARAVEFAAGGSGYADACHLCFLARRHARENGHPQLAPAHVYTGDSGDAPSD
jgi:MoaA/NifB/PqqE/SkfB family radical SAM enzyme